MDIRQKICASLGKFLCAKFETQENISKWVVCNGTNAYISHMNNSLESVVCAAGPNWGTRE